MPIFLPIIAQGDYLTKSELEDALKTVVGDARASSTQSTASAESLSWLGTSLIISSVILVAGLLTCTLLLLNGRRSR